MGCSVLGLWPSRYKIYNLVKFALFQEIPNPQPYCKRELIAGVGIIHFSGFFFIEGYFIKGNICLYSYIWNGICVLPETWDYPHFSL